MENEEILQPEESLRIIQKMIKASQQKFADNGVFMILWGIVLILAALVNYFLIASSLNVATINRWIVITWIGFPVLAGVLSSIIGRKQAKKNGVQTPISYVLKYMWIGYGIVLFFIIYLIASKHISPIPFILLLTAFALYIFALGIKYKPFMIGSILVLILAVVGFYTTYQQQLLCFALAILLGYLIPGIMLYRKHGARI